MDKPLFPKEEIVEVRVLLGALISPSSSVWTERRATNAGYAGVRILLGTLWRRWRRGRGHPLRFESLLHFIGANVPRLANKTPNLVGWVRFLPHLLKFPDKE